MNYLQDLMSDQTIYSLGWTIVHSLWQILIVTVLLRVLLHLFKNASTNFRYLLSATSLVLILVAGIITFIGVYSNYQPETVASTVEEKGIFGSLLSQTAISEQFSILSIPALIAEKYTIVKAWLEMNLSLIVMLWMAGILLFMLKFTANLFYVQRLKHYGTKSVSNEWQAMLKGLSDKIGVKKQVQILESVFAKGPMVIGHLKPVILLPAGLLFSMPIDQIEAIFAHELAHIRRKDYLINTLKAILEVIFFYHPAMWWISSIFDEEREHCCDDISLSVSIDPMALSKALVSAEEFRMRAPRLAAAFIKKHHQLYKRIRRMNTKKHKTQKFNGRPVALAVILTGLIAFVLSSSFTGSDGLVNLDSMMPGHSTMVEEADYLIGPSEMALNFQPDGDENKPMKITTDDGNTYKVYFKEGPDGKEISEVWLDGKKVPENKWKNNENFFISDEKLKQEKPDEKEIAELKNNLKKLSAKTENMQDMLADYKKVLSASDEGISQKQKDYYKKMYYTLDETEKNLKSLQAKISEKNDALAANEIEKANQIMINQKETLVKMYAMMEQLETAKMDLSEAEQKKMYEEQMKMKEKQEEMLKKERWTKFQAVMKYEMIEDGIIKKGDYATIELSTDVLKVNDKKQSTKSHEKYLKLMYKVTGEKPNPDAPYGFIID